MKRTILSWMTFTAWSTNNPAHGRNKVVQGKQQSD